MGWRAAAWRDFLDRSPGPTLDTLRWSRSRGAESNPTQPKGPRREHQDQDYVRAHP